MNNTFSPELIARSITYFREKYGQELTEEEAIAYLNSLADLFEAFHTALTD